MIKNFYTRIIKFLFWRNSKSSYNTISTSTVEKYFDTTQSIIFDDKYARKEELFLLPIISSYDPKSILDLGCGNGRYAKVLCKIVKEYFGVDLSNNFITALNNSNKIDGFNFFHSPAHKFKTNRKFDLILMIGLITYMNDNEILEMNLNNLKHLNKGGIIIVRNVNHNNQKRSSFDDRWNVLKYIIKKPTYQIIRRPESEFLKLFSAFNFIKKYNIPDTAGVIYIYKYNG